MLLSPSSRSPFPLSVASHRSQAPPPPPPPPSVRSDLLLRLVAPVSFPAGGDMDGPKPNPRKSAEAGFSDDALVEVLSRLPVKPLHRSKCVGKAWRDLVDDPLHREKLPQTLEGFLVMDEGEICGGGSGEKQFDFFPLLARSVPLEIDPTFSFLTKLPGIEALTLSDSCNGLLLFEHGRNSDPSDVLGYIVCNPATEQWHAVPTCGCPPPEFRRARTTYNYLVFDPAASSHFHLVQFCRDAWVQRFDMEGHPLGVREEWYAITVHAYSSETGTWIHSQSDWDVQQVQEHLEGWRHESLILDRGRQRAFVNGMLHFIISDQSKRKIVAVDVLGKTRKVISLPAEVHGRCWPRPGYLVHSQERLHYINQEFDADGKQSCELSIWVLEDYDTQEWVLKHTVAFLKLFGKKNCIYYENDFRFLGMHPDCNVVFFVQPSNLELISYDMDRQEVSVIGAFKNDYWRMRAVPYVPYFKDSMALTNKS
ncbi:hypothetical protein ACP70R_015005 [Stipagrostis hirtigluma subsp. patula]